MPLIKGWVNLMVTSSPMLMGRQGRRDSKSSQIDQSAGHGATSDIGKVGSAAVAVTHCSVVMAGQREVAKRSMNGLMVGASIAPWHSSKPFARSWHH